ncbi:uncharacterized protein [Procambarus clarkii]|uniref:uncharacterized protein n=1 Tax=Procambarus clarkii TaxID=6728 RepID=UPI00374293AF
MIVGNNPQVYVRILNILYKANGLPAFNVPDEVYTNTTSTTSSQDPDPVSDITVNAAVLTDLLSTAATPAPPATLSLATQTPTPPPSTTATVPPIMCEPSECYTSAAGPIKPQQARTHPSRSNTSASESADSSDEDVSVGTPLPPRKHPNTTEDFLLDTTSNDSLTMSTHSKTNRPARKPGKKKKKNTDDLHLRKSSKQKNTDEML